MTTANIAQTKVVPAATRLTPYWDDFDEDKNFHRFIFRPGYAVQARELTQIQTMLQNQIERFGNHIFQNGSLVLGGQISLDKKATHINLQSTYVGSAINALAFKANTITLGSGNAKVRAYVYDAKTATGTEPDTLIIKYLTGDEFSDTSEIKSSTGVFANAALSASSGDASLVSINDGIFFINGYFVKVPQQTIVVDKYTDSPNVRVGLEYSEDIITESDDTSLLDPAQESSNYQAPGAARLRINFDLVTRSLSSTDDENFVELLRVENGIIKKQITVSQYAALGDTLARRTYDESGDYTVRPFLMTLQEHPTDNTKIQVVLDPGKAYIRGYEYQSIAQQTLDLNKARDTKTVTNRAFTMSVGNYVNVFNVANTFDTSAMELVDIHSVNSGAINTTNAITYAATKMGTARVAQMRYFTSANTADANTDVFSLALFDARFANLTTNAIASSANGISLFDTNGRFALVDNAYVGSTIRVISGPSAGEKYNIVRYNGAGKFINIADSWILGPTSASQISIDFDMDSANSIVKNTTYTAGAPAAASANIHVSSKESTNNYTRLYDITKTPLIYRVNDRFVKANSITGQTYSYYKYLSNPTAFSAAGSTSIALSAGETFFSTNDSTGIAYTTLAGIQAFRTSNGKRITLSNVSIDGTGQTATLAIPGEGATVPFKAFVRVNITTGTETKPKTKTLRSANTTHKITNTTQLTQTTSAGTTTSNVNASGAATGQAIITNPSNDSTEWMSLFVVDVKKIQAVYDLNGAAVPADGTALSAYNNVTSDYKFDTGQRDAYYDHAAISLKASKTPKVGPLIVVFDYYEHTSGNSDGSGYFNVDSYVSPETYAGIPTYIGRDGTEYPLADSIDFRPSRTNLSSTAPNYTLNEIRIPVDATSFTQSYDYYLPRKSYVALTTNFNDPFKIIDGISDKIPTDPSLIDNAMVLYKLTLDPYTLYKDNVAVQFIENKRYTMRDIGKLEKRIENLEYYQLLNILEKSAESMKILDSNGLERTKYGMIADDFVTQAYGAVNNPDYLVAIDTTSGGLFPASNTAALTMTLRSNTNTVLVDDVVMLNYTEEAVVSQNTATKWSPVQPYMLAQWVGNIVMDPPADNWVETKQVPDVVINNGVNDAIKANTTPNNPLGTKRNQHKRWFGLPKRTS